MRVLYTIFIRLYVAGIYLSSLLSARARLWVNGRKNAILSKPGGEVPSGSKTIWFHCASLGEFEQGRPVIERFRKENPTCKILLTFFSPSGYEIRKDYPGADYVGYLPQDTPVRVRQFLDTWQPALVIFVKYEYWYNLIYELGRRGIPVTVISAIFRPGQHFFRFYGQWFLSHLRMMRRIFVQDDSSLSLLKEVGIRQVVVSGDTRFDRVFEVCRHPRLIEPIEAFARDARILVAGSTWEKDELLIANMLKGMDIPLKLIIAPHHVDTGNIDRIMDLFGERAIRFSLLNGKVPDVKNVLVIDSIGMLSHIYQYGTLAYIGGGFGVGIHNILEAAAFGLPVMFGPNYRKFNEALELLERGGAFSIRNATELTGIVRQLLGSDGQLQGASRACADYIAEKTGATDIIVKNLSDMFA